MSACHLWTSLSSISERKVVTVATHPSSAPGPSAGPALGVHPCPPDPVEGARGRLRLRPLVPVALLTSALATGEERDAETRPVTTSCHSLWVDQGAPHVGVLPPVCRQSGGTLSFESRVGSLSPLSVADLLCLG